MNREKQTQPTKTMFSVKPRSMRVAMAKDVTDRFGAKEDARMVIVPTVLKMQAFESAMDACDVMARCRIKETANSSRMMRVAVKEWRAAIRIEYGIQRLDALDYIRKMFEAEAYSDMWKLTEQLKLGAMNAEVDCPDPYLPALLMLTEMLLDAYRTEERKAIGRIEAEVGKVADKYGKDYAAWGLGAIASNLLDKFGWRVRRSHLDYCRKVIANAMHRTFEQVAEMSFEEALTPNQ